MSVLPDPIAAIETYKLAGAGEQGAYGAPYGFVVKVTTRSGVVGYGESDTMPDLAAAVIHAGYLNEMMSGIVPVLIGVDATDPAAAWQIMCRATSNYGRDGVARHAMAAVDIALWDIAGKAAGQPVHALLGGARRTSVETYGSHPLGADLAETAGHAARLVAMGFNAVKFGWHPLGLGEAEDVAIVSTLREAIGADRRLLIDGGMAYNAATAARRARLFRDYDVTWLEEPLPAYDIEEYGKLAGQTAVPIAAGEMAACYEEAARLLATGAVDILQVDISRTGLTEAMRIAALAERLDVPLVNHTYSYVLNAAASLHFVAVVHRTALFECQATSNEIRAALDAGQLRGDRGRLEIPQAPGLGVTVDEAVLERFRV